MADAYGISYLKIIEKALRWCHRCGESGDIADDVRAALDRVRDALTVNDEWMLEASAAVRGVPVGAFTGHPVVDSVAGLKALNQKLRDDAIAIAAELSNEKRRFQIREAERTRCDKGHEYLLASLVLENNDLVQRCPYCLLQTRTNELATTQSDLLRDIPDDLRAAGWAVGCHNDYRQDGSPRTFWLLTKGGRCVVGEGRTDAEALDKIRERVDPREVVCQTFPRTPHKKNEVPHGSSLEEHRCVDPRRVNRTETIVEAKDEDTAGRTEGKDRKNAVSIPAGDVGQRPERGDSERGGGC